ncbi:importin-13 [Trichogramma pretiosum]|uniref:importin-13 n=1 Tax=Trichogramma pretiosum TaxID=7493 RepID=UPI0006C951FC|nr:importin-13 [Trichogramma pretiosum]XP_014226855.1 importin-13 [Trichogramma pretiosum]
MDQTQTLNIEDALKTFYASGNNEAHSWLVRLQESQEAWSLVWKLLDSSKPPEVQFYAANTLYSKISKQWCEVPKSEYSALQSQIIQALKHSSGTKIIASRLCQALAAFMANYEDTNRSAVDEVICSLPCDTPDTTKLVMKIFEALPSEFDKCQQHNELKNRQNISRNWRKVAEFLQQIFHSCSQSNDPSSNSIYILCLECAASWLKVDYLSLDTVERLFPYFLMGCSRFLPKSEDMDDADATHGWELALECLTMSIVNLELTKRPLLFFEWTQNLILMVQDHGAKHYYDLLSSLGETHSRTILLAITPQHENNTVSNEQHKWLSQKVIDYLLECCDTPGRYPTEEKQSCIPLGFWYALQDDLDTLETPIDILAKNELQPIYTRLTHTLLKKSTLPPPNEAGSKEDKELFRIYRQDISDTLIYCFNVLRQDLLVLLGQRLMVPNNDVSRWNEVEASIHGFRAICDHVIDEDNQYIAAIMDLLLTNIPYDIFPREVLCSACSAMGDYAEWIYNNPEPWLERALHLVILGLTAGPITSPAASLALKDICRECNKHLEPLAPTILQTIGRTLPNITPGGGEDLRLMYAAGKLLNSLSLESDRIQHLDATVGLCVMRLKHFLQSSSNDAQFGVINNFKMITTFFSSLEKNIGNAVLNVLIPIFQEIVSHPVWRKDEKIIEAMFHCAQKAITTIECPEQDAQSLFSILLTSYKIYPHPAALDFLKLSVLMFGRAQAHFIGPIFAEINSITLQAVATCRANGDCISDYSKLLEEYLSLLGHICKKNPGLLSQVSDQLLEMLRCGIGCLLLPEYATVKAAGYFLTHAITTSPHLQTFIHPVGQELICVLLQCIGSVTPRSQLEPHAEVLLALNKTCFEWTAEWLQIALIQANAVTENQRNMFVQDVLRERTNKRRLYNKLQDFSLLCRQSTGAK